MNADSQYKKRLREWIEGELPKHNGSFDRLAAALSNDSQSLSGTGLKKWHRGDYVKPLGQNMLGLIAGYRGKTSEQINQWLLHGDEPSIPVDGYISQSQISGIYDLAHLCEIQGWVSDRISHISTVLRDLRFPADREAFLEAIAVHAPLIAARGQITQKRIRAICAGKKPTPGECRVLASYFVLGNVRSIERWLRG